MLAAFRRDHGFEWYTESLARQKPGQDFSLLCLGAYSGGWRWDRTGQTGEGSAADDVAGHYGEERRVRDAETRAQKYQDTVLLQRRTMGQIVSSGETDPACGPHAHPCYKLLQFYLPVVY